MKKKFIVSSRLVLTSVAAIALLNACGDDVTQVTENYEMNAQTVKNKSLLPHCNSTKTGAIVFVSDSSQLYVCDGSNWASLQGADGTNGIDGKDGADGKQGERGKQGETGANGESCSAKSITKDGAHGFEITCGNTIDTLWNGRDGEKGEPGMPGSSGSQGLQGIPGSSGAKGEPGVPGSSGIQGLQGEPGSSGAQGIPGSSGAGCIATEITENGRTGVSIVCGDESNAYTLWNGSNGMPGSSGSQGLQGIPGSSGAKGEPGVPGAGCEIVSDVNGVITIVCGEGESAVTTTIYKAMCNGIPYDPAKTTCLNGVLIGSLTFIDTESTYENGVSNEYHVSQIGKKLWMDNLRAKATNPSGNDGHCGGFNNSCNDRGALYTLNTAKSICPEGWNLPTVNDWQKLFCYVNSDACNKILQGNFTGTNVEYTGQLVTDLKATRIWEDYNKGNDTYGFDFIPSGYYNGSNNETGIGFYWAEQDNEKIVIKLEPTKITIQYSNQDYAASVRCVKDIE